MSRLFTLRLVDSDGSLLGALPPFEVDLPWWMESAEVVASARRWHGVEVAVLGIRETEPGLTNGGKVTSLAELVSGPASLEPSTLDATTTADPPLRPDYAQ